MKLSAQDFKRFKELSALVKSGKATEADKAELARLQAMKNERGSNDITWWKNYPELLKDVTNVAFNYIPGMAFPIVGPTGNNDSLRLGVLAKATLRPAIGRSVSDADAFNSQIRQLWLDMHRKYRGIGTYEKSDLGIAILAINSAFETLAKFERIYGVINTYHVGNRVVPYALKEALQISDNLEANLADFRYQLNLRIAKLKQLCLPKGMSNLAADIIAISNIFKDSANRRAFMFLFDTDTFGTYNATSISAGGCVFYNEFKNYQTDVTPGGHGAFTLNDVMQILDFQIGRLLNDDDIARMCSDLLAAYGPENVMQLEYLPENYLVEPVEDYERSLQFHNLTICGNVCTIYDNSIVPLATAQAYLANGSPICIYQQNNTIMCRLGVGDYDYVLDGGGTDVVPVVNYSNQSAKNGELIFDTWVESPGETEVMCGTRYSALSSTLATVSATTWRQEVLSFGTKVCSSVEVYNYDESVHHYDYYNAKGSVVQVNFFQSNIVRYMRFTQMDWHPTFYVDSSQNLELFGDIDNIAKISSDTLSRIHEVALLSGFKIPMVSRD